ncbi:MAG: type IX secretion system outer membrane channel protein PorV [Flavobacteriaceae bacterium]|jgi:hypothetical protein|nr:type IX secretion system outer membrane channel protein PorV [Flavobacteriaceae bacterium]
MHTFKEVFFQIPLNQIKNLVVFLCPLIIFSQSTDRVITTGVPFLLITPDARAAGMGELGVASSADAFSQQWNPAKYVFTDSNSGFGISYTPYLSQLVDDIFLGNLTYYRQISERSSWAGSLKYFSLGDIQFNEIVGGSIVDQGVQRPNELTLDISYALKLSEKFSLSVGGRFIRSDLKISMDVDATSANSLGVDIAGFYKSDLFDFYNNSSRLRIGFNISNIGPRLKYDEGGQMNFIPTNLRIGSGFDIVFDDNNLLGIHLEASKLLVPSPVASYNDENEFIGYKQPDINFLTGIFRSFNDAPDGVSEELKEVTWALGFEYLFNNTIAFRTGYFNESEQKGSRRYITLGTGFSLNFTKIDISYLFSTARIRNPLENTLRFSLTFNINSNKNENIIED